MIQLDRIEAEIASWLFWSETSIGQGITTLRWDARGDLDPASGACYAGLEEYLRLRCGGASLQTLRMRRDRLWQGDAQTRERPLLELLRAAASDLWQVDGSRVARPRRPEEDGDRVRRLTLAMPIDLQTAVLGGSGAVDMVPDALRDILQQGVAQVHVHLGACMSFATLWEHVMVTAGTPFLDPGKLERGGPSPFGNGNSFRRWLIAAALVRATLAGFLYWQERGRLQRLTQFVDAAWPTDFESTQHRLVLRAVVRGEVTASGERSACLYRRLAGVSGADLEIASLEKLRERDPVRRWLSPAPDVETEAELLRRAFAYLESTDDGDFARLFWQYVRVRGRTYRHIVQESGTAGLDWFSLHFQRISALRSGLSRRARIDSAYALEGSNLSLTSLEVREAPEPDPTEIRQIAQAVCSARPESGELESGVVLHFKKEWRDARGRPHTDPRRMSVPCRYGRYALDRLREVHAITHVIRQRPAMLTWLRGLDMCSEELSVPNWVLLPMLGRLREQSRRIAEDATRDGIPCKGLRLTLHCGEDFRSLAEGLRRLHEPIEFGYLQLSDRVGHALALGINVDRFLDEHPYSIERAEDRLENLIWEWSLYESGKLNSCQARRGAIEDKIQTLGRSIYGEDHPPQVHREVRALRMQGWHLDGWRYPRLYAPVATTPAERVLLSYLCDPAVYLNGQRTVRTSNRESGDFLRHAQQLLRNAFRERHITIEANPSSNLLIGNFTELAQLPIFRLAAPVPSADDLQVAIADDDPLTFATSLHQELVYAYMARRKIHGAESATTDQAEASARAWVDQRRQQAVDARFTVSESVGGTLEACGSRRVR